MKEHVAHLKSLTWEFKARNDTELTYVGVEVRIVAGRRSTGMATWAELSEAIKRGWHRDVKYERQWDPNLAYLLKDQRAKWQSKVKLA
jgi:hypothetical protein